MQEIDLDLTNDNHTPLHDTWDAVPGQVAEDDNVRPFVQLRRSARIEERQQRTEQQQRRQQH
tara:strand:+ start:232 stop:417 length:186 start_codon:yes stop_codon:yes gene_type:complete